MTGTLDNVLDKLRTHEGELRRLAVVEAQIQLALRLRMSSWQEPDSALPLTEWSGAHRITEHLTAPAVSLIRDIRGRLPRGSSLPRREK